MKLSGLIDLVADKATFGHLTKEKLQALPMTVPPFEEGKEIIKFLDLKLVQMEKIETKIDEIYRTSARIPRCADFIRGDGEGASARVIVKT